MALQSLRDEPNTAREYETTYILRPDTNNEGVAEINARVRTVIEERGGTIVKVDNWGKRKLAYEIRKELKGIYLYWHYLAQPGVIEEIERNLRMIDTCIRYYTIKIDENVDPTARPVELSDDDFVKASQTAADEEEIVSGYRATGQEGQEGQEGQATVASDDDESSEVTTPAASDQGEQATSDSDASEDKASPDDDEASDDDTEKTSDDDEKGQE